MIDRAKYNKEWQQKNLPGPGVIGRTFPLAPGAVNPVWKTEESVKRMARKMVKEGLLPTPKKKRYIKEEGL